MLHGHVWDVVRAHVNWARYPFSLDCALCLATPGLPSEDDWALSLEPLRTLVSRVCSLTCNYPHHPVLAPDAPASPPRLPRRPPSIRTPRRRARPSVRSFVPPVGRRQDDNYSLAAGNQEPSRHVSGPAVCGGGVGSEAAA
eukprot:364963-Chlamydomonas_euryale.AAC.2